MKQVNLGSQGLRVLAIGLGCMGMSDFYGSSSEAQNLGVLDRAADIGCTFWDTSDAYGPFTFEILLSKALKGRREQITVATKFGVSRGEDGSWQGIRGSADRKPSPVPTRFIPSAHSRPNIPCGRGTLRPTFCQQFDGLASDLWLTVPSVEVSYPGQSGHEAIWTQEIGGWRIRDLPRKPVLRTAGWPML